MKEKTRTVTKEEIKEEYNKFVGKKVFFIFLFIIIITGIVGVSTSLGSADITVWDVYPSILRKPFPNLFESELVFNWDDISGNDTEKLKQYIISINNNTHDISWMESVEFSKSGDGRNISMVKDESTISIKLIVKDKDLDVKDENLDLNNIKLNTNEELIKAELRISNGTRIKDVTGDLKVRKINGSLNMHEATWLADTCVWNLRLPRIILGILAGIGLGLAGAVMQGILRNPLASPYTLGISSGAGFGASLAILAGAGFFGGSYLIVGNAFIFALLVSFIILGLSSRKGATPETMILAGIAMMYFFGAMTTMLQYFADSDAVKEAVFWMVGDLSKASWDVDIIIFFVVLICVPLLMIKSWDLNVMGAGDETATSLGVNVKRTRIFSMIVATIMVASIVSFTGTIGFIGLVAPHMTRLAIGGDNRYVLPISGLLGAVILCTADLIARTILAPTILPVGAITAFMGAPLFIYLIMRRRREYW